MTSFIVTPASLNWQKCSQNYEGEEIWFADGLQNKGQWGATQTKMILYRERTENDPPSEDGMIKEEFPAESLMRAKILAQERHLAELRTFLYKWFQVTDLDFYKKIKESEPFPRIKNIFDEFDLRKPKNLPYKIKNFFKQSTLIEDDKFNPNNTDGTDHG